MSYQEQTGKTSSADQQYFNDLTNKGWKWTGDMSTGGWTAPPAGYKPGALGGGLGGGGVQGGGGMGGSSTLFGGTSFGGSNPFATDAAAAKLRDEFARMKKSRAGAINEDAAARGTFSSGVTGANMNDAMTQLDLQEGAGLENLFNNASQQQLAFQLEQQRMAMDAQYKMYGGGSQRFGNANQNQQMQSYYNSKDQQNAGQYGGAPTNFSGPIGNGGGGYGFGGMEQGMADLSSMYGGGTSFGGGSMPNPIGGGQFGWGSAPSYGATDTTGWGDDDWMKAVQGSVY